MNQIQINKCPSCPSVNVVPLDPNPPALKGYRHWKCNSCDIRFIVYKLNGDDLTR